MSHINAGFEQVVVVVAEGVFLVALFWVTWYCSSVGSSAALGFFIRCRVRNCRGAALVLPAAVHRLCGCPDAAVAVRVLIR